MDRSLRRLADHVITGFEEASDQYHCLSGGWELHMAPEYYSSVKIAERLAAANDRYVTLEQNISDTVRWSGPRQPRPDSRSEQKTLPNQGRFDIAVWGSGSEGILGVIEIKEVDFITYGKIKRDVVRVCSVLKLTRSLKWAMVAYYGTVWDGVRKSGKDRLDTRTQIIEESAMSHVSGMRLQCARVVGTDRLLNDDHSGIGRAEVLVFSRYQRNRNQGDR